MVNNMEEKYKLYKDDIEGNNVTISVFKPLIKVGKGCVIIFAGGGYASRCSYEDVSYAHFINSLGLTAFVVDYRVYPNQFPDELLDARTAVRFVRKNADKFNIDSNKIAVMGSSAGGHLCALLSTYREKLDGEDLKEYDGVDYLPSAQILCYPVISAKDDIVREYSYKNLLGELYNQKEKFSPDLIADEKTPIAFIWHTFEDQMVNVINSYRYAERLKEVGVPTEMHIFPFGLHGKNLSNDDPHVGQWKKLLENWLRLNNYFDK